jgi:hypothetical protein
MGWLLAFIFASLTGVLGLFLFIQWSERRNAGRQLLAATERIRELEKKSADAERLKQERDAIAQSFLLFRGHLKSIEHAKQEHQRILSEAKAYAEKFNAQAAAVKAKLEERQRLVEETAKAREAELASLLAERHRACDASTAAVLAQVEQRRQLVEETAKAREAELARQHAEQHRLVDEQLQQWEADARRRNAEFNGRVAEQQQRYEEETKRLEAEIAGLRAEHQQLTDESNLRHLGFYEQRYNFTSSVTYQNALDANLAKQKEMVKSKSAATCNTQWALGGSVAEGKKHTDKLLSLMLRAFNGECESAISRLRATNYQAIEDRISRVFTAVNKLGAVQACELSPQYLELKVDELRLSYEHALKVQAEREQQRELKEQMRQEAIAARELEKAMQEAEAEEHRGQVALERARQELARAAQEQQSVERQAELEAKLKEMEQQLEDAHAARERAISRAQQTKSGHVYVISNIGSFGEGIYKIGMTRRLDPMDRIWELSDASVPFDFDVHAVIYTDDAPGLESELHKSFGDRRLNLVNDRKEFFHATIEEIAEVVRERCGDIELTLVAEGSEFFQSEARRQSQGLPLIVSRYTGNSFAGSQA